jgi:hypothetical protein
MWLISVSTSEGLTASRASDDTSLNSGRPSVLGKLIGMDLACHPTVRHLVIRKWCIVLVVVKTY